MVTGTDLHSEHLGHVRITLVVYHGVFGRFQRPPAESDNEGHLLCSVCVANYQS